MNDSGLWKRGLLLLALVGVIAAVALFVALRRPGVPADDNAALCPELLTQMFCTPAATPVAPFPASVNWGVLYQVGQNSPSAKGWEIRYNATLALARKGAANLPFDTLAEMLDEHQQLLNFSICDKKGNLVPDETAARRTVVNALQALAQWYKHPDRPAKFDGANADLKQRYDAGLDQLTRVVEQLTQSPNPVLNTEALKTLQVLQSK
jgi:hypothetical protein